MVLLFKYWRVFTQIFRECSRLVTIWSTECNWWANSIVTSHNLLIQPPGIYVAIRKWSPQCSHQMRMTFIKDQVFNFSVALRQGLRSLLDPLQHQILIHPCLLLDKPSFLHSSLLMAVICLINFTPESHHRKMICTRHWAAILLSSICCLHYWRLLVCIL
jgi:hypothetical protein